MKKIILLFFCALFAFSLTATPVDSISSKYEKGEFITNYHRKMKATAEVASDVADYLVDDFHNSPGHLFEWALKDMGLQNKSNELIIVIKTSSHDVKTNVTHGVFDIIVPGITTFKDVRVDAIVSRTKYTNGVIKVTSNIIYSSLLLKNATGTLLLIPQKNNDLRLETNVKINFGWFFNLFITKRRYKSIVEWRIKKFTENIMDECERKHVTTIKR